ncbi:MAG: hypothetical protein V4710_15440, partial [Verrucomicrobiota bacterium]
MISPLKMPTFARALSLNSLVLMLSVGTLLATAVNPPTIYPPEDDEPVKCEDCEGEEVPTTSGSNSESENSGCPPGSTAVEGGSVNISVKAGKAETITNGISVMKPAALFYQTQAMVVSRDLIKVSSNTGAEIIRNGAGQIEQVKTSQSLVIIEALAGAGIAQGIKISVYPEGALTGNKINGRYVPIQTAAKTIELSNPVGASNEMHVKEHETTMDVGKFHKYLKEELVPNQPKWTLERWTGIPNQPGAKLSRRETMEKTLLGNATDEYTQTRRIEVPDSNGVLKQTDSKFERWAIINGRKMLKAETLNAGGVGGTAKSHTYEYGQDETQANFGRLISARRAGEPWKMRIYEGKTDAPVQTITTIQQSGSSAYGDQVNARITTEIKTQGAGTIYSQTVTEKGQLISKRRVVRTIEGDYFKDVIYEQNGTGESSWRRIAPITGQWKGRPSMINHADGTAEIHQHAINGSSTIQTVSKGEPNAAGTGIVDGTRTVTTKNSQGFVIAETVHDIASGLRISSKAGSNIDAYGRVQKWTYNQNAQDYSEIIYGCCGIESERTRDGLTTAYMHDDQGRVTLAARSD